MKAIEEQELSQAETQRKFSKSGRLALEGCGKTLCTPEFRGRARHARRAGKARRVDLAHLVSLVQPNRPSRVLKKATFSPAQPRRAKTRCSAGKAAASEEARRYSPHFVWPFAFAMGLGERKNPYSASDLRGTLI